MKKYLPFLSGAVVITVVVAAIEYVVMKKTDGHFCYPLDDTFIHMAVAKNMALHGNWGIAPGMWTSTSSSPLFTILLSIVFKLVSINIWMPFLISVAGSFLMLVAMQQELSKHSKLSVFNQVICIVATIIIGAVPALTLLGMEHTLQIAFTLFFVHSVAGIAGNTGKKIHWQTAAWAALMTFTRYENASLIVAAFVLLVWLKQYKAAFIIGVAGALPLLLFGLYSKMHGMYFIPNSVMIKANQNFKFLLNGGNSLLENAKSISGLIAVAMIIALRKLQTKKPDRDFYILSMLIIAGLMHAAFASFGWFYRYEAYLIVLGTLHLSRMALEWWQENGFNALKQQFIWAAVFVLLLFNLPLRGLNSLRNSIRAIYNIYEQQYQMGSFVQQFYPGQTVAANDIGAISFYGNLNTVDMWGLGNNEVANARKHGYWSNEFLQKLVSDKNTRFAVMYDSWFDKDLPNKWVKVATWEMPYNYICGDIKVTFYGITAPEADTLKNKLSGFEPQLPKDIKVQYFR